MNTTVFDVARYILVKMGNMSAMKLQKLVYYSQAWSLAWDDCPLFDNRIEAWADGPVCRDLYEKHRGIYAVNQQIFDSLPVNELDINQKDTINKVLEAYGGKSAQWLSNQTHVEAPWIEARRGLSDRERGSQEITQESMASYYCSLN